MHVRAIACALLLVLVACEGSPTARQLDLDRVTIGGAHLRTDAIGDGKFTEQATFVLIDANNANDDGAYITLGGELTANGDAVGELKTQSLWVPAHGSRTFALVDDQRAARPTADGARVLVRGASADTAPIAHVDGVHDMDDYGKRVVQGELVNDADRPGTVMVIASFHDARGKPMTRPFEMIAVAPHAHQAVQFVGPPGSVTADLYVGDIAY